MRNPGKVLEKSKHVEEHQLTVRFPQLDPAGIMFYPRFFELIYRFFPEVPLATTPFTVRTDFLKPVRLGDRLHLLYERGESASDWSVTGLVDGERHYRIFTEEPGETMPSLSPPTHPFRTTGEPVGNWMCNQGGRMLLSRYLEILNMSIEEWMEDTLGMLLRDMQYVRNVGIPTVRFLTRCHELPRAGEQVHMRLWPTRVGHRAMSFTSWLVRDDTCLIESEQVIVFVRFADRDFETIPIPDDMHAAFSAQLAAIGENV